MTVAPSNTVSIRVVRELLHTVEHAGISRATFLQATQLDSSQLDSQDARISRSAIHRLCELAIELTENPALGLHWGEGLDPNAFAPISHLLSHSPTLRDAFESLTRFQAVLSDDLGYALIERDDQVIVRCSSLSGESLAVQRFVAEMLVTGLYRLVRFFNPRGRMACVSLAYSAPAYRDEYTRVFEAAERFDQPFTGLVFDSALMSSSSPHRDEDLHEALRSVVERRVVRLSQQTPFARKVYDVLVQQRSPQRMDMDAVARRLGLSTRSLRRRLSDEGKPYGAIVNEACAVAAKRLLLETQHTIQEVAYEIGFSEPAAFHRAFKRWTGMTPSEFRQHGR